MILNYYFQKAKVLFFFLVSNPTNMVFCNLVIFFRAIPLLVSLFFVTLPKDFKMAAI